MKLDSSVQNELERLKEKGAKREFLKLISTQPLYGCLHFKSCVCDFPEPDTKTLVSLGNRTVYFRTFNVESICLVEFINSTFPSGNKTKTKQFIFKKGVEKDEIQFRITRIRCWKVSGVVIKRTQFFFLNYSRFSLLF